MIAAALTWPWIFMAAIGGVMMGSAIVFYLNRRDRRR